MSAQAKHPPASRRSTAGICPHCGQALLTQRAVRHLRTADLELERRLEAALRAAFAELTADLAVEPATERARDADPHAERQAEEATESRDLRLFFRQF